MRRQGRLTGLAVSAIAALAPADASADVRVDGATLRVTLGSFASAGATGNGVQVHPLAGGGVIVSFHGSVNASDQTAGSGCQPTPASNAPNMPGGFPGAGGTQFAATCTIDGVRVVEGRLGSTAGSQGWLSTLNLPTNVTATSNLGSSAGQGSDRIMTGDGGDRITGGNENDRIDPGSAPYKGQEARPPTGTPTDDPARNEVSGGAGNDTIELSRGTGRDVVTGGAGVDTVSYAARFPVGAPGAKGVNVTLDGTANDGDPAIHAADMATLGEGDNIGTDVENVVGTKRDDTLIGNGLDNTLTGNEGVDTLTGNSGEDVLLAREPAAAGSGIRDNLSCGPPLPRSSTGSGLGILSFSTGIDRVELDLADVKPADCEELLAMAVDEPAPIDIGASARRILGGSALGVTLTCPRAARRTCRGTLRLAGTRAGSRTARFSLRRGARRTVRLNLTARAAHAASRGDALARILSHEDGLEGDIERVEVVRVR